MERKLSFIHLNNNEKDIRKMSFLATSILREYYDDIIGVEQNTYMLNKFQTPEAIKEHIEHGYNYYFIALNNENIGFLAYYFLLDHLYLSKLYLAKEFRHQGFAKEIIEFIKEKTLEANLKAIELNVNKYNPTRFIYEKLNFVKVKDECNDIGNGYFMDDFVYRLEII